VRLVTRRIGRKQKLRTKGRAKRVARAVENRLVQQRYAFLPAAATAAAAPRVRMYAHAHARTRTRRARQVRAHRGARSDNMYAANIQYHNTHVGAGAETQEGRASLSARAWPAYARLSAKPSAFPSSFFPPPVYRVIRKTARARARARVRKTPRTRILSFTVLCTCESTDSFPFFFFSPP